MKNKLFFLFVFCTALYAKADLFDLFLNKLGDKNTLESYFKASQGCGFEYSDTGSDCCVYNEGERFCSFELIKPLNAQGEIILRSDVASSELEGAVDRSRVAFFANFKAENLNVSNAKLNIKDISQYKQNIESKLPDWFKEGFLGEVKFKAKFNIINENANDSFTANKNIQRALMRDITSGLDESLFNVANLELEFLEATPFNKSWYEKNAFMTKLIPNTKDAYVNLRKVAKGEILTQIQMKDKNNILILNLDALANKQKGVFEWQRALVGKKGDEINSFDSSAWIKVAYFPKGVNDISKAIVGYIHKSQVIQAME